MKNPFPNEKPLTRRLDLVLPRGEFLDDLMGHIANNKTLVLLGPRRYGKTSLLKRIADDLTPVRTTIWLDVMGVRTPAAWFAVLDRALDELDESVEGEARLIAVKHELNLGILKSSTEFSDLSHDGALEQAASALSVVAELAEQQPLLFIVDEVQQLADVDGALESLRTAFQHVDIPVALAGSQPSLVRQMFGDSVDPARAAYFQQATVVEVPSLPVDEWLPLVDDAFRSTQRAGNLAKVAGAIHAETEGHPRRSMQLAAAVWDQTDPGDRVTETHVAAGIEQVRGEVDFMEREQWKTVPTGKQSVLLLAAHDLPLTGRIAADYLGLNKHNAQKHTANLESDCVLTRKPERHQQYGRCEYRLVDPFFADWLRQTHPDIPTAT